MINWANFISQCFNGLVLGALLALISSGLTIIYGTLGVLNLAHGAMFMLGGYAGWMAYSYTGSFIVAVFAGAIFVMIVGVLMERVVIRYFYKRPHEDQLLVTFGLGIDVYKVFMLVFGIGAMAAGFAGIINAPVVSIAPDVGEPILVHTFVVVVIGGVGSFLGAVIGGLIAGEIISITSMFNPGYSYVMLFAAMTLVLVLRPYGLLGAAGRE